MTHAIRIFLMMAVINALLLSPPAFAAKGRQSVPFTYVIMGDPQYPWWQIADLPSGCNFTEADTSTMPVWDIIEWDYVCDSNDQKGESNADGTVCSDWSWKGDEDGPVECAAKVENQNKVDGIKDVKNLTWPETGLDVQTPEAIIINGDLTAYFHPWQLDGYEKYYLDKLSDYWVLAGLGNHDYQNNTGSCYAGTTNSNK